MFYASNFPQTKYSIGGNEYILTDITKRFRFVENVIRNKYVLFTYTIKQGQAPHVVAQEIYGDSTLDWILFLTNGMIDPYFDWPLEDKEFSLYLTKKYGSIAKAKNDVYSYRRILQKREILLNGSTVPEKYINVDHSVYQNLPFSERRLVSMYDYEIEANEKKREIKVIEKRYIPEILQEFENLYVPSR